MTTTSDPSALQRLIAELQKVQQCAEALRIVDFNEHKQQFFCRACRYRDPLGDDGNKLHDDNCPWVDYVRAFKQLSDQLDALLVRRDEEKDQEARVDPQTVIPPERATASVGAPDSTATKKTIYVVTHGCYSDYGITAVFDRRDLAVACAGDPEDVEEYALNPGAEQYFAGLERWTVEMYRDGRLGRAHGLGFAHDARDVEVKIGFDMGQFSNGRWPPRETWAPRVVVNLWARDEAQAVKAANETRAQLIASGEWDRLEDAARVEWSMPARA